MGWLKQRPEAADEDPGEAGEVEVRRRHGFFRRFVLRLLMWGLALVAALIFLGDLLINTPGSREWARREIATRLAAAIDREVSLEAVSFELLPFTVTLEGLRIGGGKDFPDDPFLVLPRAEIEGDLEIFARRRLRLRLVKLDRPRFDLRFTPHGDNLIGGGGEGGGAELEVLLDRLEIDRGELRFDDQEIELSFVAEQVRSHLVALGRDRLQGDLAVPRISLRLPAAQSIDLALQGRVALTAERVEIEESTITGPGLELDTRGLCDWSGRGGQGDKCDFETRGTATGSVLASLGYFEALAGPFDFDGRLSWRGGPIGWRGRISAKALALWSFALENLDGQVSADRFGVRLQLAGVNYAGGQLHGNVEVDLAAQDDPLTLELALEAVAVDQLADDLGIPVTGIAAQAFGRVGFKAPIRSALHGNGEAEVELRAAPELAGLPFEGPLPLRLDNGVLRFGAVSLRAPDQGVLVGGEYDLVNDRGRISFEVATSAADRLVDLVLGPGAGGGATPPPWAPLRGIGRVDAELLLERGSWRALLDLDLEQVTTPRLAEAEVRGSLELTPKAAENLRLDLGHAGSALTLAGRVPYDSQREPIELKLDAFSWPLAEVSPWLNFELPLEGPISGHLELLLADQKTRGTLDAHVAPARIKGQAFDLDNLEAHLAWDDEKLRFHEIEARAPAGLLRGGGSLTWQDYQLELKLRGSGLDIAAAPLAAYRPSPELGGQLTFEASLQGPLSRPRVELEADLRHLLLGSRALPGNSHVEARWDGHRLDAEAVLLDAVRLHGGGPFDENGAGLVFDLRASELGELLRLAAGDLGMQLGGELAGRLEVSGPLADPDLLFELDQSRLLLADHLLIGEKGARLRRHGSAWQVDGVRFAEASSQSSFRLDGAIDLEQGLALTLRAELGAEWIGLLTRDLGADFELAPSGRLSLDGRLLGTASAPSFEGRADLLGLDLALPGLDEGLRDLRGTVLFTPGHVDLGRLEGKLAGGRITVSGQADLPRAAAEGRPERAFSYAIQVSGRDLGLRRADGWAVAGDVDLTLRSLERGHFLGGRVDLERFDYRREIRLDVATLLRDFLRRQRLEVQPVTSTLAAIQLNLEVKADKTVRVVNNLADLRGSADFSLRGTLAAPLIYGEISIEPGGRLRYNGSDYRVERGRLIFADPFKIDPEVDLVAQTRVREFDINLALFGNLNRLETRFASTPPLPDVEVFRLLAEGDFGGEPVQPTLQRGDETSLSAASFLYGQAASAIGERVSNLFGLDKFRVDPLVGTSGDTLSAARVTVGKRLSRRLSLTYSVDPSTTESQRLQVEWRLSEGLVLVLTQNGDNTYSADARWDTTF